MAEAEREIPDFPTLLADTEKDIARLESPVSQADALSEIKNTVLPLIRDLIEAIMIFGEDIQDEINPVKLNSSEAQDIGTLLQSVVHANPGNAELAERVNGHLESLDLLDEPEDEESN